MPGALGGGESSPRAVGFFSIRTGGAAPAPVVQTILEMVAFKKLRVCPVPLSEVRSFTLSSVSACLDGCILDLEET